MANWSSPVAGAWNSVFNAANTPTAPSFSAGDWLFIYLFQFFGSNTPTTPGGWTLVSPNSQAVSSAVYAFRSVTGSESMPSMTLGTGNSYACVVKVSGGPTTVSGIVHASADRISTSTSNMAYPTGGLTVTQPNCLILACGARNKTSASNGATFTSFGGTGNGFGSPLTTTIPNGAVGSGAINLWIQTTATTVAAGGNQSSISDATNQGTQASIIALLPGAGGGGSTNQSSLLLGVGS